MQANENLYFENFCFFTGDLTTTEIINDNTHDKAKARDTTAIIDK